MDEGPRTRCEWQAAHEALRSRFEAARKYAQKKPSPRQAASAQKKPKPVRFEIGARSLLAMRSEESFFHETHQERIQKKPQHVQRSLNQRVLSPCLLSNGKRPLPRNPQRKHVQKNWVLCNGNEAVSTKPTKIHVQKKPKPERVEALGAMQRKAAVSTKPTKIHVQKKPKPERVEALCFATEGSRFHGTHQETRPEEPKPERVEPLVALQREGGLFHETHQETRPKEA